MQGDSSGVEIVVKERRIRSCPASFSFSGAIVFVQVRLAPQVGAYC